MLLVEVHDVVVTRCGLGSFGWAFFPARSPKNTQRNICEWKKNWSPFPQTLPRPPSNQMMERRCATQLKIDGLEKWSSGAAGTRCSAADKILLFILLNFSPNCKRRECDGGVGGSARPITMWRPAVWGLGWGETTAVNTCGIAHCRSGGSRKTAVTQRCQEKLSHLLLSWDYFGVCSCCSYATRKKDGRLFFLFCHFHDYISLLFLTDGIKSTNEPIWNLARNTEKCWCMHIKHNYCWV